MGGLQWREAERDECARMFGATVKACGLTWPNGARVLEIGSAENDWLGAARKHWPQYTYTGIDWRTKGAGAGVVKADVLTYDFPPESFDVVVAISTIEHIGLGHYDRDPVAEDGDTRALARAYRWLTPGGLCYVDVPWDVTPYQVVGTKFRCYDDAQYEARLKQSAPWIERWRGWFLRHTDTPLRVKPSKPLNPRQKFFYVSASVFQKGA